MTPAQIVAVTAWSEDRSGGALGMEPIIGVIMNRAEWPGGWRHDITTPAHVCMQHGQFDGWNWADPNFAPMHLVDEKDAAYCTALSIAERALAGGQINRAGGATHYFAKTLMDNPPLWYWAFPASRSGARSVVFETNHHLFFKIGPHA